MQPGAPLALNTAAFQPCDRTPDSSLPVNVRTLFGEDRATLPLTEAAREAERCANCGCVAVNASDVAPALLMLDATIVTTRRRIPAAAFSAATLKKTTTLAADELIEEIFIPAPLPGVRQGYRKFRIRNAIDFPIVGLAYRWAETAGRLHDVRLVAVGVAPLPVRLTAAEAALEGRMLDAAAVAQACAAAAAGGQPLAHNQYKLTVLQGLVRKTLTAA